MKNVWKKRAQAKRAEAIMNIVQNDDVLYEYVLRLSHWTGMTPQQTVEMMSVGTVHLGVDASMRDAE